MAAACRFVDDPSRTMDEPKMVRQVAPKIAEAVERHAVPETAATPGDEQALRFHLRDRTICSAVTGELDAVGLDDAEALEAARAPPLGVGQNPRVRPRVDQRPAGRENPVHLA